MGIVVYKVVQYTIISHYAYIYIARSGLEFTQSTLNSKPIDTKNSLHNTHKTVFGPVNYRKITSSSDLSMITFCEEL